ncbi:MAG TPA: hypothetical protein VMS88_07080 [Terriglobales bacterium]|nr:hypothetical protein [Terriglobales bacterium]
MSAAAPQATRRARRGARARRNPLPAVGVVPAHAALPPDWRPFVGRWLEASGCTVSSAARGDWEVELSPELQKRWRRQRVRLVFDPLRPTLPRGAWFTAPGSAAGRRILDALTERPAFTQRTALVRVPGAPEDGVASVCRVRGLTWGPARLGPVRYERRVSFHAVATRWGGLPWQEPWVVLMGPAGELLEWHSEAEVPDVRSREGVYQMEEELEPEQRARWMERTRAHFERLLEEREQDWESQMGRLRDGELERLGAFYTARLEEEQERLRRRQSNGDEIELEQGDSTTIKLEWDRRAAEVRARWQIRTQVRVWGLSEWSWPVADLEQELRSGAVRVRLRSRVDVARGRPELPACPSCGNPAEMLVRAHGAVACARCAPG